MTPWDALAAWNLCGADPMFSDNLLRDEGSPLSLPNVDIKVW
ncbi:MAG: hypothetical protein ACUVSN_07910 [Desulfosoma sp.]